MINKRCIHAVAKCRNCGWGEEDYLIAMKKAIAHSKKYKHVVEIEKCDLHVIG